MSSEASAKPKTNSEAKLLLEHFAQWQAVVANSAMFENGHSSGESKDECKVSGVEPQQGDWIDGAKRSMKDADERADDCWGDAECQGEENEQAGQVAALGWALWRRADSLI